jgi:hypothetical protein
MPVELALALGFPSASGRNLAALTDSLSAILIPGDGAVA